MFDNLAVLGYGIITFAIIIGVGTIVLTKVGNTFASCPSDQPFVEAYNQCSNSTTNTTPTNGGFVNVDYMNTQLGTTGLAGWTPAIIALSVGMLFLGVFLTKGGRQV